MQLAKVHVALMVSVLALIAMMVRYLDVQLLMQDAARMPWARQALVSEEEDDLPVKPFLGLGCKRKDYVVYVRPHKTGSTTISNMFGRFSLKHELNMMALDTKTRLHTSRFVHYMLDRHPSLHKLDHIHMVSEHIVYNRTELDRFMPPDTVYLVSLREPFSQFKSTVNDFLHDFTQRMKSEYRMAGEDAAVDALRDLRNHFRGKAWTHNEFRNINARTLGFNASYTNNQTRISEFLQMIDSHFSHVFIAEFLKESLIVMRRKLCWEISDILHLSLNVAKYKAKKTDLGLRLEKRLRNWSEVDTLLYNTYSKKLEEEIIQYGDDFRSEMAFFTRQLTRVRQFCRAINKLSKEDAIQTRRLVTQHRRALVIPASPWGQEYRVDHVWCLMSSINLMSLKNIIRVKEFPEMCKNIARWSSSASFVSFHKRFNKTQVYMHPAFCSKKLTPKSSTYQVPMPVILNPMVYKIGF